MIEMERLIAEARRNNQPAYIAVPSDFAVTPVVWNEVNPVKLASNNASLEQAVAAIQKRMDGAKSIVALPAFTLARLGLEQQARKLIEALGCPFATTAMEKGFIGESHPQFAASMPGRFRTTKRAKLSRKPI